MEKYTYKKLTLKSFIKMMNDIQEKIPSIPVAYIIKDRNIYKYIPKIEYNTDTSTHSLSLKDTGMI